MENNFLKKTTEGLKKGAKIGLMAAATTLPLKEAAAQKEQKPIIDEISIGFNKYKASDRVYHIDEYDKNHLAVFDAKNSEGTGISLDLAKDFWKKKKKKDFEMGSKIFANINSNKQTPFNIGVSRWWEGMLGDNAKITADLATGITNPFNTIEPYARLSAGFRYDFLNKDENKIGAIGIKGELDSRFGKFQTPMGAGVYGEMKILPNLDLTASANFASDGDIAKSANYNVGLRFTFPSGEKSTKYIKYKKPFNGNYKNARYL